MEKGIMVDIETTSRRYGGVILEIAAVVFNTTGYIEDEFFIGIDRSFSIKEGFTENDETLKWWYQQRLHRLSEAFNHTTSPYPAILLFREFMLKHKGLKVFVNGATFDPILLQGYFDKYNFTYPWDFRAITCIRSLKNCIRFQFPNIKIMPLNNNHHPLDDCKAQVRQLLAILDLMQFQGNGVKHKDETDTGSWESL